MKRTIVVALAGIAGLAAIIGVWKVKQHQRERPERFAFVVGIGDANFPSPIISAREVAKTFDEQLHIPSENTVLLTGTWAELTEAGILKSLDELLGRMPKNGTLFVYVGGHGYSEGGQSRWVLAPKPGRTLAYSTLDLSNMDRRLATAPIENVFGFYESCRMNLNPFAPHQRTVQQRPKYKVAALKRWVSLFSASEGQISNTAPDHGGYLAEAIEAGLGGDARDKQGIIRYQSLFTTVRTNIWAEVHLDLGIDQLPTADYLAGTKKDIDDYELARVTPRPREKALDYRAKMLEGYSLWLSRNDKAAMEAFKAAGYLNPGKTKAWEAMAAVTASHLDYPHAIEYQKKATQVAPDNAASWCTLGGYLFAGKKYSEADQAYKKSLALYKKAPIACVNDGLALIQLKKYPEAEAQFRAAMAIEPRWSQPHWQIVKLLSSQRRYAELKNAIAVAIRDCPEDPTFLLCDATYTRSILKNPAQALPAAQSIAAKWPDFTGAHIELRYCLLALGRKEAAAQQLVIIIKLEKQQKRAKK